MKRQTKQLILTLLITSFSFIINPKAHAFSSGIMNFPMKNITMASVPKVSEFQLAKAKGGNDASKGQKAKRTPFHANIVKKGNDTGGGSYVGFPKSNVKKYTKHIKAN